MKKILLATLLFLVFSFSGCVQQLQGLNESVNVLDRERFMGTWTGHLFLASSSVSVFVDNPKKVSFTFFSDGTYLTRSNAIHKWNVLGKKLILTANETVTMFTYIFDDNDTKLTLDNSGGVVYLTKEDTKIWREI